MTPQQKDRLAEWAWRILPLVFAAGIGFGAARQSLAEKADRTDVMVLQTRFDDLKAIVCWHNDAPGCNTGIHK